MLLGLSLRRFVGGAGIRAQLLRGGAGSIVTKLFAGGLQFVITTVLARSLGAEGFGIYAFVFALLSLISVPAQFGLANLVVRETARAQANCDWGMLNGMWRWATRVVISLSAFLLLTTVTVVWLLPEMLSRAQEATLYWGLPLIPLIAITVLHGAALRGLRHVVLGQLPDQIVRPLLFLLFFGGCAWVCSAEKLTPVSAMASMTLAAALAAAIAAFMVLDRRPEKIGWGIKVKYKHRTWAFAALPLALTQGMGVINSQTDVLMLGSLMGANEVGVYRVATQTAALVAFGLQSLNMVVAPHFARLHAVGDKRRLQQLVSRTAQAVLGVALIAVTLFGAFGDQLIFWLFGEAFSTAYFPLVILALGQLVNAGLGAVGVLLTMTGKERIVLHGITLSVVINLVLNALFIPLFGMVGAALASALSLAGWNIYAFIKAKEVLGITSHAFLLRPVKSPV